MCGGEMNGYVIPAGHEQSLFKAQLLSLDCVSEGKNNTAQLSAGKPYRARVKILKHADQTTEQQSFPTVCSNHTAQTTQPLAFTVLIKYEHSAAPSQQPDLHNTSQN